jgi:hypothetical protein
MLCRYIPRGSVELWGAKFIKSLISITNKQWLYRNSNVHHVIDGLSSWQQQELTTRICELLETKKNSLLEQHKHLMEVDFIKLGSGTTIAHQVWIANVEMAISVAKVAHGNFCTQETLLLLRTPVVKTSSHLQHKEVPSQTPSKHTGSSTKTKPRTTSPRHTARSACLSKAPYFFSRNHRLSSPLSKQTSLLFALIPQPRNAMKKTLWKIFPTATPTTDLTPYDKICVHLHRLHTRIKASDNRA